MALEGDETLSCAFSVGVGGVTVVTGVVSSALGGVLGGSRSVSIGGRGFSNALDDRFVVWPSLEGDIPFSVPTSYKPPLSVFEDSSPGAILFDPKIVVLVGRSGLDLGLFPVLENASLSFLAGDTPRSRPRLLELSAASETRNVSALSVKPGAGRTGVDSSFGIDLGEGSGIGCASGSTIIGNASVDAEVERLVYVPGPIDLSVTILIKGEDVVR